MTPEQKALVKTSFEKVVPISDLAAALFYNRLFELDPSLRTLFLSDLKEQGRKLMTMLKMVVNGLDRIEFLLPAVDALGQRHARYRVPESSYDTVGEALLWTLAQGLGDAFTHEVEAAWVAAYRLLAGVMKEGALKVA
ncbi:MAG TPA: globin family protein [Chloroflexia bacterium]|nr:globin family protein [Chloroflexia bacterium]